MSTNLNAPALVGGQANPETTANDAVGALDAALTETVTVDLTNNATISSANYTRCVRINVTPSGSGKKLTLQASKKFTVVTNSSANAITLKVGTTEVAVGTATTVLVYTDGTANGLATFGVITGALEKPHDLHLFISGKPVAAAIVMRLNAVRQFVLPASLTGSVFNAGTASAGTKVFTIKKNGSSIGTITFTASATGVASFASDVTLAVNDVLSIEAPAVQDANLADVSLDFLANRS